SDCSPVIHYVQTGPGWKSLLQLIIETITMTKPGEIIVAKIDIVANLPPVHARSLRRCQPENDQHDQQKDAPGSTTPRPCTFRFRVHMLDQLAHAPHDDQ